MEGYYTLKNTGMKTLPELRLALLGRDFMVHCRQTGEAVLNPVIESASISPCCLGQAAEETKRTTVQQWARRDPRAIFQGKSKIIR